MSKQKIVLYGAGLIGCGWATHLLLYDHPAVTLYDICPQQLSRAERRIAQDLKFLEEEGLLRPAERKSRLERLQFTTSPAAALEGAWLVKENGPENLELKRKLMAEIEDLVPPSTLISSSTSGISISAIAKDMRHPQRLVGAHPYHPVYLIPLVELVGGQASHASYLETLAAFYRTIGKEPVILKKEAPGYIASRLMSILFRESAHLIQEGVATMEDIERAFTYGPGLRYGLVGINTTLQLAGGEQGLAGVLFGGIGSSGGNWLESVANFTQWPAHYAGFWQTCQDQINRAMANRPPEQGQTTAEIERFRDRGLVQLLKYHGKLPNH